MRVKRLHLEGMMNFRGPVDVDFEALGPGLIAIAGRNGQGKTSLLEASYAGLYGEMPSRPGALYGVCHGHDARIELAVDDGEPITTIYAVDAERQTSEAFMMAGVTPVVKGKVTEFKREVERRFGSPKLMLSAALSCQTHRGSFLDLSKAERKELLAEILDTGGLQKLAEAARAKAKDGVLRLDRLRGQIVQMEIEIEVLERARSSETFANERADLQERLSGVQSNLEAARTRHSELQTEYALAVEAEKQRKAKNGEIGTIDAETGAIEAKLKAVPGQKLDARARAGKAITTAQQEAARLPEYNAAAEALAKARAVRTGAETDVKNAELILRGCREELLEQTRATGKGATIRTKLEASRRQAGLLGQVPCTATSAWILPEPERGDQEVDLASECPLLADARGAKATIEALEADLVKIEALEAGLPQFQRSVDLAEELVQADRDVLAAAQAEAERLAPLAAGVPGAQSASKRSVEFQVQLDETIMSLVAREQEYREALDNLEAKKTALVAEMSSMERREPEKIRSEVDEQARCIGQLADFQEGVERRLREIGNAIAVAEAAKLQRMELLARTEVNRQQVAALETELEAWMTLDQAFGRDGIQALLIDAAGPELSALTNELLSSCFGSRFTARFVTQVARKSGEGMREDFDIHVTDSDRGQREGSIAELSGGEKVIVGEAIALALAIYVGNHCGKRFKTLWRDETAGALDPENGDRYIAMLRRARIMAGAEQVVFIAQQPRLWEQADAVLYLEGGQVEVRQ